MPALGQYYTSTAPALYEYHSSIIPALYTYNVAVSTQAFAYPSDFPPSPHTLTASHVEWAVGPVPPGYGSVDDECRTVSPEVAKR